MSELETIANILPLSLGEVDPALRKRILGLEIRRRWNEIFGTLANDLAFVKLDGKTLVLESQNSAVRDAFKYGARILIDRVNAVIRREEDFVDRIEFGRNLDPPPALPTQKTAPAPKPAEVELTADEIAACEQQAAAISDPDLRKSVLETLISCAKAEKSRRQNGWHKCQLCDRLCPPREQICDICRVKERERLHKRIRRIFYEAPWTPFREIQEKIRAEFTYLKSYCTLDEIEAARMDLILQVAARVPYGDTSSDAAKFLVMLARQLPREKLTLPIINRTLHEFRFNLADRPPFEALEFARAPGVRINKIKKSAAQTE